VSAPSDSGRLFVACRAIAGVSPPQSEISDAPNSSARRGATCAHGHTFPALETKGDVMNKDQVKGRVEETKGKVKEVAGHAVGNPDLEDRGTIQKVGGSLQKNYGDLKEDVKDAVKKQR
jgi:uncharacterized protein YjbJ (UPF0337 family)